MSTHDRATGGAFYRMRQGTAGYPLLIRLKQIGWCCVKASERVRHVTGLLVDALRHSTAGRSASVQVLHQGLDHVSIRVDRRSGRYHLTWEPREDYVEVYLGREDGGSGPTVRAALALKGIDPPLPDSLRWDATDDEVRSTVVAAVMAIKMLEEADASRP